MTFSSIDMGCRFLTQPTLANISHRAASLLSREQLKTGRIFTITGGNSIQRTLLQTKGYLNDQSGIYILDPNNKVTHQRFIKGGNYRATKPTCKNK